MWNITLCSHDSALTGQIRHCYTFFYPSTRGMLPKGPMIPSWSGQGGPRAKPGQDGEGSSPISASKGCCWWASKWGGGQGLTPHPCHSLDSHHGGCHRPPCSRHRAGHCRALSYGLAPWFSAAAWFVSPPLPPLVPGGRGGWVAGRAHSETSETADPRAPA